MFHLNEDNKVTAALSRITDLVFLQLLFLLTSIPIVTIGAGLSAMFTVCRKLRLDTISEIGSTYFHAFAEGWKKSTVAWLLFLLVGVMLYVDFNFYADRGALGAAARVLAFLIGAVAYLCFVYLFPMLAWLENRLLPQMKNALILSLIHAGTTALVTLLYAAAFALSKFLLPIFLFIGFSGPVYLASGLLLKALSAQAPELLPSEEEEPGEKEEASQDDTTE